MRAAVGPPLPSRLTSGGDGIRLRNQVRSGGSGDGSGGDQFDLTRDGNQVATDLIERRAQRSYARGSRWRSQ
jgi:hypothetical protein